MARHKDMHWSDIKAKLEKKDTCLAEVAHSLGISRVNVSKVSWRPCHKVQCAIATALGMKPRDVWPTRYYASNGKPIRPSVWMRNNSRTAGIHVKKVINDTPERNSPDAAKIAHHGNFCRHEPDLNSLFLRLFDLGMHIASSSRQRPLKTQAEIKTKSNWPEQPEMRIGTMGNLLSFPMNAWNILKDKETPSDEGLFTALAFLRDCLEGDIRDFDDATVQRCMTATETALSAAMNAERKILHQSLHIEEMERVASTDELTGAYNRRGFEREFRRVLAAAERYNETGILIYADLDGFKPINDTYGHAAGDHVLREVVRTLDENVRPHDLIGRLGGDEFAVLLTRTDWKKGMERAEILKHVLNTKYVKWNSKHIAIRASLGFQRFGPGDCNKKLLMEADTAMYEAKRLRMSDSHTDIQ